jgi:hypothetical protein
LPVAWLLSIVRSEDCISLLPQIKLIDPFQQGGDAHVLAGRLAGAEATEQDGTSSSLIIIILIIILILILILIILIIILIIIIILILIIILIIRSSSSSVSAYDSFLTSTAISIAVTSVRPSSPRFLVSLQLPTLFCLVCSPYLRKIP